MSGPGRETRIHKRQQRLVGVVTLVGLVGIALFLFLKAQTSSSSLDDHVAQGTEALDRALSGEVAAWDDAEHHFQRAAGGSIMGFERYPIFCLAATMRLREITPTGVPAKEAITRIEGVDVLLVLNRREDARVVLTRLSTSEEEKTSVQASMYLRLLTDVEVAAHKRSEAPP